MVERVQAVAAIQPPVPPSLEGLRELSPAAEAFWGLTPGSRAFNPDTAQPMLRVATHDKCKPRGASYFENGLASNGSKPEG